MSDSDSDMSDGDLDMFNGEDVCVGCKHPIVDENIKGDITLWGQNLQVDLEEVVVGARSRCRNCSVILDAVNTFVGTEDPSSIQRSLTIWPFLDRYEEHFLIQLHEEVEVEIVRRSDLPHKIESSEFEARNVKEYRSLSDATSSHETVRAISAWITQCIQHHEHCTQRLAAPLPKRILEITADHILLREQHGYSALYACLSHCWGPSGPAVKLTAETIERLRDGLEICDLPKTFRDAVEMCRHLGIHYIWIDALCILQDSEEDWAEAAATMGDIYENSHITIAATASEDSKGGLFSSTRPVMRRLNKHPHLYVRASVDRFPKWAGSSVPKSMPLLTRAWVYQERRLSTRTIHFGKYQVYWECKTQFASEDAGEDMTWNKKADASRSVEYAAWGDKFIDCTHWQRMLSEYISLRLTYEKDRLPAIAALANRMSKVREADDVYIAGVWKNSILSDLWWFTHGEKPRSTRMAPSWSWASTQNSGVMWGDYAFPEQAKVVSLEYTAVGPANFGEVINASLVLIVPVLDLTGIDELIPTDLNELNSPFRFMDICKSAPIVGRLRQYSLAIFSTWFSPDYDLSTTNPPCISGRAVKLLVVRHDTDIRGIVLQQTQKISTEYERIGNITIGVETAANNDPEKKVGDSQNGGDDSETTDAEGEQWTHRTLRLPLVSAEELARRKKEKQEAIDSLILSLMDKVKIV